MPSLSPSWSSGHPGLVASASSGKVFKMHIVGSEILGVPRFNKPSNAKTTGSISDHKQQEAARSSLPGHRPFSRVAKPLHSRKAPAFTQIWKYLPFLMPWTKKTRQHRPSVLQGSAHAKSWAVKPGLEHLSCHRRQFLAIFLPVTVLDRPGV